MEPNGWQDALKLVVLPNMLILLGVLALGWDLGQVVWTYVAEAIIIAILIVVQFAWFGIRAGSIAGTLALTAFGAMLLLPAAVIFSQILFMVGFTGLFPLKSAEAVAWSVAPLALARLYVFAKDRAEETAPKDSWSAAGNVFGLAAKALYTQAMLLPALFLLVAATAASYYFTKSTSSSLYLVSTFVALKAYFDYRMFRVRKLSGWDLFISLFRPRKRAVFEAALEMGKKMTQEGQKPGEPLTGTMEQYSYGKGNVFVIRKSGEEKPEN